MNFILTASSFLFPLITFPYVSRTLLPAGNGKVDSAMAVVSYFTMVAMLGIPTYGIRACAQVRDDKEKLSRTVQEILAINLGMAVLVYVVFGASLAWVPKFAENRTLFLVMGTAILLNVIGVSWLYAALEQYAYITAISMVMKALGVVLMFLFVHQPEDFVIYGGITVISNVGSYIFNFLRMGKYVIIKPLGNYNFKRHMKPIAIFCAMTVATSIYTNLDIVMLNFISGDVQTGYYSASVKVKTILASLVTSLGAVLLPRLSYYIEKGMQKEFKQMAVKALQFVWMMALPVTIYFMMFAKESIGFLSGQAYAPAAEPMCIILPTVVWIGLSNIFGMQILVPTGREKEVMKSVLAGGMVDLALNLALIPKLGASGAAIGTVMAELVVVLVQMIALKGFLSDIQRTCRISYYFVALLPAMAGSWLVKKTLTQMLAAYDLGVQGTNFLVLAATAAMFFGIYLSVLLLEKEPVSREYLAPYLQKWKRKT